MGLLSNRIMIINPLKINQASDNTQYFIYRTNPENASGTITPILLQFYSLIKELDFFIILTKKRIFFNSLFQANLFVSTQMYHLL